MDYPSATKLSILFAATGFISVFAGATNTPLACTLIGIELFGGEYSVYFAVACFIAYLFSGHSGIYLAQRIGTPKFERPEVPNPDTLREVRNRQSIIGRNLFADMSKPPN